MKRLISRRETAAGRATTAVSRQQKEGAHKDLQHMSFTAEGYTMLIEGISKNNTGGRE